MLSKMWEPLFPLAGLVLLGTLFFLLVKPNMEEGFGPSSSKTVTLDPSFSMGDQLPLEKVSAQGQFEVKGLSPSGNAVSFYRNEEGQLATIEVPPGFYIDKEGQVVRIPLGAAPLGNGGFQPITLMTQFGSTVPVSSHPEANNLIKYNKDNFNMTYHSIDPAQYFGLKDLLKVDGSLDFTKLYDLYPNVQLNKPPYQPTYADAVLFSEFGRKSVSGVS